MATISIREKTLPVRMPRGGRFRADYSSTIVPLQHQFRTSNAAVSPPNGLGRSLPRGEGQDEGAEHGSAAPMDKTPSLRYGVSNGVIWPRPRGAPSSCPSPRGEKGPSKRLWREIKGTALRPILASAKTGRMVRIPSWVSPYSYRQRTRPFLPSCPSSKGTRQNRLMHVSFTTCTR